MKLCINAGTPTLNIAHTHKWWTQKLRLSCLKLESRNLYILDKAV